jgi:hypothetical protein
MPVGKFISTGVSGGEVFSEIPLSVTTKRTWADKMFKELGP